MRLAVLLFVPFVGACSSTTSIPGAADGSASSSSGSASSSSGGSSSSSSGGSSSSSSSGNPGNDASTDGGFDFVFANSGANIAETTFKVAPVQGSFCQGASPNLTCSFTGSITNGTSGCTAIVNAAFVGDPVQATSFQLVADAPTPAGKGEVAYTEYCTTGATKMWKSTGGTLTLTKVTPPPKGLPTGTLSFTIAGATLAVAPLGAGDAKGSFTVSGTASNVTYLQP
jgi:hypothetical protein